MKNYRDEVIQELRRTGAFLSGGHFKLVSGNHSDSYVHVRLALSYSDVAAKFAKMIADEFKEEKIDAIFGFTVGGIRLAEAIAWHLNKSVLLGKKEGDKIEFVGGFDARPRQSILIVDDVLTTGGLISRSISMILGLGCEVAGIAVVVDRSIEALDFGVKAVRLAKVDFRHYTPNQCPMCLSGRPPLIDLSNPEINPYPVLETLPAEQRDRLAKTFMEIIEKVHGEGTVSLREFVAKIKRSEL